MEKGKERIFRGVGFTIYHQNFPKKKLQDHSHKEAHLFIPLQGSCLVQVDANDYELSSGQMMFIGGNVLHNFSALGELGERLIIQFDESLNKSFKKFTKRAVIIPTHKLLKELCLSLFPYSENSFTPTLQGLILEILIETLTKQTDVSKNMIFEVQQKIIQSQHPQFRKLTSLMQANLEMDLPEISKIVGLSPRSLTRLVQAEVGLPPKEIYTFFRVQKACQLMFEEQLNLTGIAYECGYNSLSQFILNFKKWTGVKPSEFRSFQ